jgi:hypothetical protein
MDDHTVRVSNDTLDKLKDYKGKWSLSYNDIISMALDMLDGADLKEIAVEAPVYRIKVSLNRVRINDNVMNLLKNGYDLFIPDITHRQAMYVKRKLLNKGFDVEYNKGEADGKTGYLFSTPTEPQPRNAKPETQPSPLVKPSPAPID